MCFTQAKETKKICFEHGEDFVTDLELAKPFVKAALDILGTMANIHPHVGTPFIKKNEAMKSVQLL